MTDEPGRVAEAQGADGADEVDEAGAAGERHASWTELFFDLVAVVGVGQLAHLLHGSPGLTEIGLYALMFLAFWIVWMSFAMFGMAVMAASVTGARFGDHGGEHGDHANAFALAYVLTRLLASWVWKRRDAVRVAVDWPIAQAGICVVPWVVSLWVRRGATRNAAAVARPAERPGTRSSSGW